MPGQKPVNGASAPAAPANSPKKPTNGTPTTPMNFSTPEAGVPAAVPTAAPIRTPRVKAPAPITARPMGEAVERPMPNYGLPRMAMPSYHKGGVVSETGPAVLKKNEVVLTPEKHEQLLQALKDATEVLSADNSEPQKPSVKEMNIRKSANDGFIVRHKSDGPEQPGNDDREHIHSDLKSLHGHIDKFWGEPKPEAKGDDTKEELAD
jgi:hypothetical protein